MDHSHHQHHEHHQPVNPKNAPASKLADNKEHEKHTGHDKHAGHHTHDFLKRFWICLFLTIPVLLLSHMIQEWLGFDLQFRGDSYVLLTLSSFIYFYGGMPFLKGMIREIRDKAIGMMTLVALAITVAFVYSVAVVSVCRAWTSFGNWQP